MGGRKWIWELRADAVFSDFMEVSFSVSESFLLLLPKLHIWLKVIFLHRTPRRNRTGINIPTFVEFLWTVAVTGTERVSETCVTPFLHQYCKYYDIVRGFQVIVCTTIEKWNSSQGSWRFSILSRLSIAVKTKCQGSLADVNDEMKSSNWGSRVMAQWLNPWPACG